MLCDIGFAVKLLRTIRNESQQTVANRLQVPKVWVGKIERREQVPTLESICRLASALQVSASTLVTIATAKEAQ
jgi:transcriptional regulator with XRE-family HTH domain